jgi:hypothetical protein
VTCALKSALCDVSGSNLRPQSRQTPYGLGSAMTSSFLSVPFGMPIVPTGRLTALALWISNCTTTKCSVLSSRSISADGKAVGHERGAGQLLCARFTSFSCPRYQQQSTTISFPFILAKARLRVILWQFLKAAPTTAALDGSEIRPLIFPLGDWASKGVAITAMTHTKRKATKWKPMSDLQRATEMSATLPLNSREIRGERHETSSLF